MEKLGSTDDISRCNTDADSQYEYRHVILPKQMLKMLPKPYVV
jgi:hypothetical protein